MFSAGLDNVTVLVNRLLNGKYSKQICSRQPYDVQREIASRADSSPISEAKVLGAMDGLGRATEISG